MLGSVSDNGQENQTDERLGNRRMDKKMKGEEKDLEKRRGAVFIYKMEAI